MTQAVRLAFSAVTLALIALQAVVEWTAIEVLQSPVALLGLALVPFLALEAGLVAVEHRVERFAVPGGRPYHSNFSDQHSVKILSEFKKFCRN